MAVRVAFRKLGRHRERAIERGTHDAQDDLCAEILTSGRSACREARHTRKSPEDRRDGYRTHVAACPETGIITGERLTKAPEPDNSSAAVAQD
jgi:hypothetical protein